MVGGRALCLPSGLGPSLEARTSRSCSEETTVTDTDLPLDDALQELAHRLPRGDARRLAVAAAVREVRS